MLCVNRHKTDLWTAVSLWAGSLAASQSLGRKAPVNDAGAPGASVYLSSWRLAVSGPRAACAAVRAKGRARPGSLAPT
ncbi:hypothetical protein GCM10009774_04250 [Cellulomonas gelida]|uniref:Uncharacterized protein n=1 Tax=Cellulomonas gelida TaxID=1712 RepID=A0A4Y3KPJ5_9CELL|nr:hypothetical protein CGE01nite_25650 [Cellulomonas gelida]GGL17015.1 hypothetical protein GCM10009774_04250 [Cellulomonas gelida]